MFPISSGITIQNCRVLEHIRFGDHSFSQSKDNITITHLYKLQTITIGNYVFNQVRYFSVNNLPLLQKLQIGNSSLTVYIDGYYPTDEKAIPGKFSVWNCPKLTSISAGDFSLTDYAEIDISNLPFLQTLYFGAYAFVYAHNLELRGHNVIKQLISRSLRITINITRPSRLCVLLETSSRSF